MYTLVLIFPLLIAIVGAINVDSHNNAVYNDAGLDRGLSFGQGFNLANMFSNLNQQLNQGPLNTFSAATFGTPPVGIVGELGLLNQGQHFAAARFGTPPVGRAIPAIAPAPLREGSAISFTAPSARQNGGYGAFGPNTIALGFGGLNLGNNAASQILAQNAFSYGAQGLGQNGGGLSYGYSQGVGQNGAGFNYIGQGLRQDGTVFNYGNLGSGQNGAGLNYGNQGLVQNGIAAVNNAGQGQNIADLANRQNSAVAANSQDQKHEEASRLYEAQSNGEPINYGRYASGVGYGADESGHTAGPKLYSTLNLRPNIPSAGQNGISQSVSSIQSGPNTAVQNYNSINPGQNGILQGYSTYNLGQNEASQGYSNFNLAPNGVSQGYITRNLGPNGGYQGFSAHNLNQNGASQSFITHNLGQNGGGYQGFSAHNLGPNGAGYSSISSFVNHGEPATDSYGAPAREYSAPVAVYGHPGYEG